MRTRDRSIKRTIELGIFLLALVLLLPQAAGAQEPDTVPFKETTGELQGQIFLVQPENNLVIAASNSIPYSFQVAAATRITVGSQRGKIEDLVARKGQTVTIRYRATRKGNIAQTIAVP